MITRRQLLDTASQMGIRPHVVEKERQKSLHRQTNHNTTAPLPIGAHADNLASPANVLPVESPTHSPTPG